MTSDFDNEEIIDSAFPVDFNEDNNSLDMYGVWVKNAPRDAAFKESETPDAVIGSPSAFSDIDTYEDISSLPDLPDFDENSEKEIDDTASFDKIDSELSDLGDITWVEGESSDDASLEPEASFKSPETPDEFDDLNFDEPIEDALLETNMSADSLEEDKSDNEIDTSFPDFDLSPLEEDEAPSFETDETLSFTESPLPEADKEMEPSTEFPSFGEVSFDEPTDQADISLVNLSSSPLEGTEPIQNDAEIVFDDEALEVERPEIQEESVVESSFSRDAFLGSRTETEDISLDEFETEQVPLDEEPSIEIPDDFLNEIQFEELTESPKITALHEEDTTQDLEDAIEASLETPAPMEMVEPSSLAYEETEDNEVLPAENFSIEDSLPSDEDFSGFLDELNASSAAGDISKTHPNAGEDLDLDNFIDQFNETGGRTEEETEKLFDDTEPVDLDLDFDEDYIADAQMIKETGSSVSESEFMSSEFGVELIDETPAINPNEDDDFEAMFADAQDDASEAPAAEDSALNIQETNEFDDLLSSLDLTPTPSAPVPADKIKAVQPSKTFDLSVSDEDGSGPIASPAMDASGEDMDVSLFEDISAAPDAHQGEAVTVNAPIAEERDIPIEFSDETAENEENLVIEDRTDYNDMAQVPSTDDFEAPTEGMNVSADFDDISAVEQELSDITPETGDIDLTTNDKSTELLMLIADELSSIKQELSILKSELAGIKTIQPAPITVPTPAATADGAPSTESGGFFTDDDPDEAIALTGDELNNILITADFTEEKNDYSEESSVETVDLTAKATEGKAKEDDFEVPDTLPDSIFDIPQITDTAEIPVAHVNSIDDDMSYLEESDFSESDLDNVAIDETDIEVIDFNDEKLEEPELAEFNIDLDDITADFPAEQEISKNDEFQSSFEGESLNEIPLEEDLSIPEEPETEKNVEDSFASDTLNITDVSESAEEFADESFATVQIEEPESEPSMPHFGLEEGVEPAPQDIPPTGVQSLPIDLKDEIKSVLSYMDQLLESLPEDKIEEFARSEHFGVYKKLFEELGIS